MRVLLISSQFPPVPGGGGAYTYYLTKALLSVTTLGGNSRNEICVLTHTGLNPRVERRKPNMELHAVPFSRAGRVPYESVITYGLELCRKFRPHVIHGQHFEGVCVATHLKAAFPDGVSFATFHQSPAGDHIEGLRQRDARVAALVALVTQVDRVIVTCNVYRDELLSFGISPEKIDMIWPGVDLSSVVSIGAGRRCLALDALRNLGIVVDKSSHVVLCPARLDSGKDLETFIRAAGALKRRTSGKLQVTFLVAGKSETPSDDENRYQAQLEYIAKIEGVADDLRFASFGLHDMFAVYRLSSACVLPSVREALGLVLIEAMALRVPVVAANVRGITDVIEPERNALDFPPRDHNKLSEQLERILHEPELAKRLRASGVRTVKEKFDHRRMGIEHCLLYKRLINPQ